MSPASALAIVDPAAGPGQGRHLAGARAATIGATGIPCDVVPTSAHGDAPTEAQRAAQDGRHRRRR